MKLRFLIIFMYLISLFWVIFAAAWLFHDSDYRYFYAVSSFGYAVFIALLAFFLNKKRTWAWWLTLIFSVLNIILTFTDQIGWFDLAYLVPAIILFVLVVRSKSAVYPAHTQ